MSGDTIIGFTDVSFECNRCHADQMKTFYVCEDSNGTADLERLSRDINKHQMTCPICDGKSFSAEIKLSNKILNHEREKVDAR